MTAIMVLHALVTAFLFVMMWIQSKWIGEATELLQEMCEIIEDLVDGD